MQKITPFLWFNNQAEEAAKFYCSILKNSKIINCNPMVTTFELDGRQYMALNGGSTFKLNESFSLLISCETQEEVDDLWEKLSADGEDSRCGWLKDKYGLSWQVIPTILGKLMSDPDRAKAKRVVDAMMTMKKIDIAGLQKAYNGKI